MKSSEPEALTNSNNDIGHWILDSSSPLPTTILNRRIIALNFVTPESPPEAEPNGISGYVLAELTDDANGHTSNIEIVGSDPPEIFEDADLEAAKRFL